MIINIYAYFYLKLEYPTRINKFPISLIHNLSQYIEQKPSENKTKEGKLSCPMGT